MTEKTRLTFEEVTREMGLSSDSTELLRQSKHLEIEWILQERFCNLLKLYTLLKNNRDAAIERGDRDRNEVSKADKLLFNSVHYDLTLRGKGIGKNLCPPDFTRKISEIKAVPELARDVLLHYLDMGEEFKARNLLETISDPQARELEAELNAILPTWNSWQRKTEKDKELRGKPPTAQRL